MTPNNSARFYSGLTEESASNCKYGMPSAKSTFPASLIINSASIQPPYNVKLKPVPTVSSTSLQNYSMPECESSPPPSITTNDQAPEADCTPSNIEANRQPLEWQYLPVILKFLSEQLTSQIPLLFGGAIGLVIVAMLISQASGGIKLKLDLEVSPAPSHNEKTPIIK